MRTANARLAIAATIAAAVMIVPAAAVAFDPDLEARNFAKTEERMQYVTLTPEFQARLTRQNIDDNPDLATIAAAEAGQGADARNFTGNICFQRKQECAGDVRFYDWPDGGVGTREPVLFGARNGATISGNVWAAAGGPAQRPGIVITTGSIQAPETLYWGLAATLAKHGYVVLTYDVQGQGRSDTFGEGPDSQEGVPSQAGQPFFDGTEDALDFLLSSAAAPYDPRPSCGNAAAGIATDHSAKHERRVAAGLNAPFNPLAGLVDADRIGIAGHSLGAGAVSYVGQVDPRVDSIVAWDNLRASSATGGGGPSGAPECPAAPASRPESPPVTKPALGISNDYGIVATPNTADPDPQRANQAFLDYREAGVDSMQVNIRGGTHFESSFIPGMTVPALGTGTLRGMDMVAWYTTAWFDKYVKCADGAECERDADRRLLTDRWRSDARGGQVDANADPNLYSFYLRSRYGFTATDGSVASCDDMRSGCASMAPDGGAAGYDFVADAYSPQGGGGANGGAAGGAPCALPQLGTDAKDSSATLPPSAAGDAIRGRGGDDRLRGLAGDDCLYGNAGDDRLRGDENADRLKGGAGDDRLVGGPGRDLLGGGPGADRINARGGGVDRVKCGPGRDRVRADRRDRLGRGC